MIRTEKVNFRAGDFGLREVTLHVRAGEYFILMGPPGSGKTVFLECMSGLRRILSGRFIIGGRDVTALEPRRRGIGHVPQSYALFRHLSVEKNIGFGLRRRGTGRKEARRRAGNVAEQLGISHLLGRSVEGLSGGEQQRVALARAIILKPKVLLLDEPVSALDEATRMSVCEELKSLQSKLGVTTIHVCHNREEAFYVADRGAVLRDGAIQQVGALSRLLRKPRNEFVARFMCCENICEGEAVRSPQSPSGCMVRLGQAEFAAPGQPTGKTKFVVRPEDVRLSRDDQSAPAGGIRVPVRVAATQDMGMYVRVEVQGPVRLVSYLSHADYASLSGRVAENLYATIAPEAIHFLGDWQVRHEERVPETEHLEKGQTVIT